MTKELFAESDTSDQPVDLDKLYEDLVGEGKKYQDPKVLLKSKRDSDVHIQRIERENAELRADLQTRQTLEEAINNLSKPSSSETPTPVERTDNALTPELIQQLIDKELAKRSSQSQIAQNQAKVINKLTEVWGDNYSVKLKARARELGLGEDFLADLATKQPDAFIKIIDPKPAGTPNLGHPASTRPSVIGSSEKTWAYYSKMRRENPKQYHSIETQREIYAQAAKLGDAFYNNGV